MRIRISSNWEHRSQTSFIHGTCRDACGRRIPGEGGHVIAGKTGICELISIGGWGPTFPFNHLPGTLSRYFSGRSNARKSRALDFQPERWYLQPEQAYRIASRLCQRPPLPNLQITSGSPKVWVAEEEERRRRSVIRGADMVRWPCSGDWSTIGDGGDGGDGGGGHSRPGERWFGGADYM